MNPAMNAGVSGGLSGAIVTIINSWFIALHLAPMTADVATAYAVVLTAGFGYFFHTRSLAASAPPAAIDAKPAMVAAPAAALLLAVTLGSYLLLGIAPAHAASAVMISGGTAGVFLAVLAIMLVGGFLAFGLIMLNRGRTVMVAGAVLAVLVAGAALSGCAGGSPPPVPTPAQIEAAYQKAKPVLDQLCGAASVAGGAAIAIEQLSGNGGDVADTQKAVKSLGDVCGDKDPANVQQDITAAKQLYTDITAKAADAAPAAAAVPAAN